MNTITVMADDHNIFDDRLEEFIYSLVGDLNRPIRICALAGAHPSNDPLQRGSCSNLRKMTTIFLYLENIAASVRQYPCGGNSTWATTYVHGVYLVLAHELRHAQQYATGGHPRWDERLKYIDQPHEIDARSFVDYSSEWIREFVFPAQVPDLIDRAIERLAI